MKNTITASIITSVIVVLAATGIRIAVAPTSPVENTPAPVVRGISSDFSNVPNINVNGVTEWYSSEGMKQGSATTTVCSFAAPTASSSIRYVSFRMGGIVAPANYSIGTSTTINGTSSALATYAVATSSGGGYIGSNTFNNVILQGTQFVNVVSDTLATTTGGTCQAEFTQF